METESKLWKLNDRDQWELYNHVDDLDAQPNSLASNKDKESESKEKTGTKAQKPSSQVFYLSKTKQEVKGSLIYTPKGYGIIQNIIPEKNIITVKVNNEIIDFEKNEVSNEIMIEFIHVQMGGKRSERIAFPIHSTAKDISERITSQNEDLTMMSRLFFKGKELPLSNDNLEKLGIDQTSKILVITKLGKAFSVNRFKQILNGWYYSKSSFEGISFSTSKDIRISGIGLYAPSQPNATVTGTVKLVHGQNYEGEVACTAEVDIKYSPNPNEKIQKVMFDKPYPVRQGEVWSIVAEIESITNGGTFSFGGTGSQYGNMGQSPVTGEGEVTFTFMNCNANNFTKCNQTNVFSGQIPEIYYYV